VVASLIECKFDIRLGLTAVDELLAKLGLTPQKPLQQAYQRDPEAIERWQRETFPAIVRQAKASGGEVYFWDELGFRADAAHGKTWGVKGQTPVVERPGQRQSISAVSAVNAKGAFWYCTYQGGLNADLFVDLLRRMMCHGTKPVHLVVDGLPAHKTNLVKDYVASTNAMLTLHFLLGYAPELNPDELVWGGRRRSPLRLRLLLESASGHRVANANRLRSNCRLKAARSGLMPPRLSQIPSRRAGRLKNGESASAPRSPRRRGGSLRKPARQPAARAGEHYRCSRCEA
jgi:transposase